MIINKTVITARFKRRPNRFQGYVEVDDKEIMVHVPNTGRCKEILTEGTTVILREEKNPLRKTPYDLIAGYKGEVLINIDSQIPNRVVEEALINQKIDMLSKYDIIEREKAYGNSRFDFRLTDSKNGEVYYLEVKGVTYEEGGKAMFPDAPTERGSKHLAELIQVKEEGMGAGVLFLIQLTGVTSFGPYDDRDKLFGDTLRLAYKSGVDVLAYDCIVEENSITMNREIDVVL
jgi:sugar fermentation stimulation protein